MSAKAVAKNKVHLRVSRTSQPMQAGKARKEKNVCIQVGTCSGSTVELGANSTIWYIVGLGILWYCTVR